MQNIFDEVGSLDRRCYEEFGLSEELLMEHAANGMATFIKGKFPVDSRIIIVCGSGNNGADGLALARLLHKYFEVTVFLAKQVKSPMAKLQHKRTMALGITEISMLTPCDVLVDALVGTGFSGTLDTKLSQLLDDMNAIEAYKIACDIPSAYLFNADITLTMGALKKSMFLDGVKDCVGEIEVLDLGVHREIYETDSNTKLLELEDIVLPHRTRKDSHKGSFGHLNLVCGEKEGASIMSALAASRFGCGLVTLLSHKENFSYHHTLMSSHTLAKNTSALACGMGLGNEFSSEELQSYLGTHIPLILDADILYMPLMLGLLQAKNIVLTPHPKEFVALLKLTGLADISVEVLQEKRFEYVALFAQKYPQVTLLLKGANVIIAQDSQCFVNPHGTSALAKGGSGDVLSGVIGSLLAQGYSPLSAAINGSLAHTKLARNYKGADFSLTADDLIAGIGNL